MYSRQKSCTPCARAKRRCVPQTPKCPRCAELGIDCRYKNRPLRTAADHGPKRCLEYPVRSPRVRSPTILGRDIFVPVSHTNSAYTPCPTGHDQLYFWTTDAEAGPTINPPAGEITPPAGEVTPDPSLGQADTQQVGETPSRLPSPTTLLTNRMFPVVAVVDSWSIEVLTRHLTTWPRLFAERLEAPFIHRSLYDAAALPLPLQAAFGVCAGYLARNDSNRAVVLSAVERLADQLVSRVGNPSALPLGTHLACLQALLIVHTIQLWDGDARQRAQAESHDDVLESWATDLDTRVADATRICTWTCTTTPYGAAVSEEEREEDGRWEEWILLESARRTALLAVSSQGLYEAARYGVCSSIATMAYMPFTVSEAMWDATDATRWRERRRVAQTRGDDGLIPYIAFTTDWKESTLRRPLGLFGKLVLTPCLGERYKEELAIKEE